MLNSNSSNRFAWHAYLRRFQHAWLLLCGSIVVAITQSFALVPLAFLIRYAFDYVIPARNLSLLALVGIGMLGLYGFSVALGLWTRGVVLRITKLAIQQLREELLQRLYAFSRSFYSQADIGQLHTVVVQDTERIDVMSNALFGQLLPALVTSTILSGVLIYLDGRLFALMLVVMPMLVFLNKRMGRRLREMVLAFRATFGEFNASSWFVIQNLDFTKSQGADEWELARQRQRLEDVRSAGSQLAWFQTAYTAVHNVVVSIGGVLVLVVGGGAVALGATSLGELLSFYVTVSLLKEQLSTILLAAPNVITGHESLVAVDNMLRLPDKQPYQGEQRIDFMGRITVKGVSFAYNEPLLRGVNLELSPHKSVAVVGPNGSGKSTLLNLILGFYRPQVGMLYADDQPYTALDLVTLRQQIGVVLQDPPIFAGSIRDNITYGWNDIDETEVFAAAEVATAHSFIITLPERYDTLVGEGGILLSGGQRQRVAIARALLRRPALLVLDEPTNHLDAASVLLLMQNLQQLHNAPALLVITHDMTVAARCDHVYPIEKAGSVTRSTLTKSDEIGALS